MIASQNGHLEVVIALLSSKAAVNQAKNDDATPLYIASEQGHLEVVSVLLSSNAAVNQAKNDDSIPLWTASYKPQFGQILTNHN